MGGKGKNTPKKQQQSPAPSPAPEQKQQAQQPQQSPAKSKAKPQNEPSPIAAQSPQPSKQNQPVAQSAKAPASPAPPAQPVHSVSAPNKALETPVKSTPSPAPAASPQVSPPAPTPPPAGASRETKEKNEKKDPVVSVFESNLEKQPEIAIAVAAIQALTDVVKRSKAATMMGLEIELKAATDKLKACNVHSISLAAGCELFNRYVTRTSLEIGDFDKCRSRLIERGDHFTHMSLTSRKKISEFGDRFIRDGKSILCHGYSRVVIAVLVHAAKKGKYFSVIVTEGRPTGVGAMMAEELIKHNIPVTIVLDSAVGYVMEKVDLVLVGAEGVVESGGIINQIGTYQIALVAKALQTPFYVAAESYKFARLFPLTQHDLPESKEVQRPLSACNPEAPFPEKATINNPRCDYTPPQYITLLFTDLGILTPSAISDELIKLYY